MNYDGKVFLMIKDLIANDNLDGIIITDEYNMEYLSGFKGRTGCLLYIFDKQYLLTDSRYTEQASIEAKCFECVDIAKLGYSKTLMNLIDKAVTEIKSKEVLNETKHTKSSDKILIGFENEHISYSFYKQFVDTFGDKILLVQLDSKVNRFRSIKTEEEIENIAIAEKIGDEAFLHIINFIEEGMTERQIALELEYFMKNNGATALSFDTIVASGKNSSMPHAIPTDKVIEHGDFITMDFGCIYNGYCSDMTRTVIMGDEPTSKQLEVYSVVLEAQREALKMIKPGMVCSDIDKVARDIIKNAGYGDYFGHGLGHSVGLFIHEEPRLSPKCNDILQENMLMTVEPGIYLPGEFGVRIEDLIVVTKDGYRNLTSSPKPLIML